MTGIEFWENEFGSATVAKDFVGREVHKGEYNNRYSQYGWNIDEIMPQSRGGERELYNCQVTNIQTNSEHADKTSFTIKGTSYQVKARNSLSYSDKKASYDYSDKDYAIVVLNNNAQNTYW